jgi:histidinol-phosphate phosphatase family protein
MEINMKVVILAGGRGTRLSSVTGDKIPKAMVSITGKPILEYQIEVLKNNDITEIIIIGGYLIEKIISYFQDGSNWGVKIRYINEAVPLGTGGGLYYLKEETEAFVLVFGDLLFDIDLKRFYEFHISKNAGVTIIVHPNTHPYDCDLVCTDNKSRVISFSSKYDKHRADYTNLVNAGIYCISPEVLKNFKENEKLDLEKDFLFAYVLPTKKLFAYRSTEYIKDLGTPERLLSGRNDMNKGIVNKKNLQNKQKAIFLDRDGTLIKYKPLLTKTDEVILENTVCNAIDKINKSEYLVFVISNQPVVARNLCTVEDVQKVNARIESLLGSQGVYLDGFEFCPHHPEKGFPGENIAYKVKCTCRKPQIGLITKLAE